MERWGEPNCRLPTYNMQNKVYISLFKLFYVQFENLYNRNHANCLIAGLAPKMGHKENPAFILLLVY